MSEWGYAHKTVNHGCGEYARDDDGDGFHEVHVNTMEGFWSLLRSWLRPHRGISQEKLPLYLGFFEFIHNAKKRGEIFAWKLDQVTTILSFTNQKIDLKSSIYRMASGCLIYAGQTAEQRSIFAGECGSQRSLRSHQLPCPIFHTQHLLLKWESEQLR